MNTGIEVTEYLPSLDKLCEFQRRVADLHPYLSGFFPIAVVIEKDLIIFDFDAQSQSYQFSKRLPTPTFIPEGVRAAFPLPFYGNRVACVITADAFDTLDGLVLILHEFIHCQQWEAGEMQLKQTLGIYKKARLRKDDQWELNYPFPYSDPGFTSCYRLFLETLRKGQASEIREARLQLASRLNETDFEYMVWQEWKEGFARYVENLIRSRLELPENHYGAEEPYNRIVFYEGGARYIEFLVKQDPEARIQMAKLFNLIRS